MPDSRAEELASPFADALTDRAAFAVPNLKNRALMRDKSCQTDKLKIERLHFATTKVVLFIYQKLASPFADALTGRATFAVPALKNRALMRDKLCQTDKLKIERLHFADNKNTHVQFVKNWRLPDFHGALMRDRSCQPYGFNTARACLLQKTLIRQRLQIIGQQVFRRRTR